jgi:hypothetical protein
MATAAEKKEARSARAKATLDKQVKAGTRNADGTVRKAGGPPAGSTDKPQRIGANIKGAGGRVVRGASSVARGAARVATAPFRATGAVGRLAARAAVPLAFEEAGRITGAAGVNAAFGDNEGSDTLQNRLSPEAATRQSRAGEFNRTSFNQDSIGPSRTGSGILTPDTLAAGRQTQADRGIDVSSPGEGQSVGRRAFEGGRQALLEEGVTGAIVRGLGFSGDDAEAAPAAAETPPTDPAVAANTARTAQFDEAFQNQTRGLPATGPIGERGRIGRTVDPDTGEEVSKGIPQFNRGFNPLDLPAGSGFIRRSSDGQTTQLGRTGPPRVSRQSGGGAEPPRVSRGPRSSLSGIIGLAFARQERNANAASSASFTAGQARQGGLRIKAAGEERKQRKDASAQLETDIDGATDTENPQRRELKLQSFISRSEAGNDPSADLLLNQSAASTLTRLGGEFDLFSGVIPGQSGRSGTEAFQDFFGFDSKETSLIGDSLASIVIAENGDLHQPPTQEEYASAKPGEKETSGRRITNLSKHTPMEEKVLRRAVFNARQKQRVQRAG